MTVFPLNTDAALDEIDIVGGCVGVGLVSGALDPPQPVNSITKQIKLNEWKRADMFNAFVLFTPPKNYRI
jgi:hypothetical protein